MSNIAANGAVMSGQGSFLDINTRISMFPLEIMLYHTRSCVESRFCQTGIFRREPYSTEGGERALFALRLSVFGCFAWSKVSSADLHVVENTLD